MAKKVGVITVHKNVNYGANLQAFASCKYIRNKGYDCKVIDYTLPDHEKSAHLFSWLKQSFRGAKSLSIKGKIKLAVALAFSIPWKRKRLKNFHNFRKKFIPQTKQCKNLLEISSLGLDTIVCGSDQIWNPDITCGINPIFFGNANGVLSRIAYAPSLGKEKLTELSEKKIIEQISSMDYLSSREENTSKYLSSITGKDFETVCDPVFLLDKSEFDEISSKRKIKKDYVLLYSIVSNSDMTKVALEYSNRHGLDLVEICASKDKNATHKQIQTYGPSEFLSAFKYANTIFTNSFHGTAFSIIFEKDFYIFDNKNGGSRITNLLTKVGLTARLISSSVEEDFSPIDYKASKVLLNEYVSSSKAFLDNALKTEKQLVASKNCIGCGACYGVCKFDAISMVKNKEGFLEGFIDKNKCKNCGLCEKVCPALSVPNKNQSLGVYAFKAKDELRKNSTSGGAFVALAEKVIESGGAVYGATLVNNCTVKHIRVDKVEELIKIQGTKYLQSSVKDCYDQIADDLRSGKKVLFSGTPCQVDGVKRFVNLKKLTTDNLYLVDIICHGVPSETFFRAYLNWLTKEYGCEVDEFKFRSKKISWRGSSCYARLKNGKELFNDAKLCAFMNVYYSDNITRESCYDCKYTSKERVSDLTISDYWGIENLDKSFEDSLGVSMIIVNTEKGSLLFSETDGEKITANLESAKQPQLLKPTARPSTREEFWQAFFNGNAEKLIQKYGGVSGGNFKTKLKRLIKKILRRN